MVKGSNRQVIVVKSPDPKLFDEAIFLLRQDAAEAQGDPDEIIRQARRAADGYLSACPPFARRRAPAALPFLLGAGLATLLWWAGGLVL